MSVQASKKKKSEEAALYLLDIFKAHGLRAGQYLTIGSARIEFLYERRWQIDDFLSALKYAREHHWVQTPSPSVVKLTDCGFAVAIERQGHPTARE